MTKFKMPKKRGGARPGAGRPRHEKPRKVARCLTLDAEVSKRLDNVVKRTGLSLSDVASQMINRGFNHLDGEMIGPDLNR